MTIPAADIVARTLLLATLISLTFSTALTSILEVLLLAVCVFSSLRNRIVELGSEAMVRGVLLLFFVVVLGLLWSPLPLDERLNYFLGWLRILYLPVAAALFATSYWQRILVGAFLLIASFYLAVSWLQIFEIIGPWHKKTLGEPLENHATQGMLFAVAAGCALYFSYRQSPSLIMRLLLAALACAFIANIIFITKGRSGYLVLAVMLSWGIWLSAGRWRLAAVLGGACLISGLLYLSPMASSRISAGVMEAWNFASAVQESPLGIRMIIWRNSLELIAQAPWLGHGSGSFAQVYAHIVSQGQGWQAIKAGDAHNQWLGLGVELGVLGISAFAVFIISMARQKPSEIGRYLGFGALIAWLGTSLFSSHFSTFVESRFIFIWCGALLVFIDTEKHRSE